MKFFIIVILLGYSIAGSSQSPQFTPVKESPQLKKILQQGRCISSLTFFEQDLYFATEKCSTVYCYNTGTQKIITILEKKNSMSGKELEGMMIFHEKMYFAAEYERNEKNDRDRGSVIFECTAFSATKKIREVQVDSLPWSWRDTKGNLMGIEGITASYRHNQVYVLLERKMYGDSAFAMIYTYEYDNSGIVAKLKFKNAVNISFGKERPYWRYSDICIDSSNGESRLYCLKTRHDEKTNKGTYAIETLRIKKSGDVDISSRTSYLENILQNSKDYYPGEKFSDNLEGMTMDSRGSLYLISDNQDGNCSCDKTVPLRTLFLQREQSSPDSRNIQGKK